MSDWKEEAIYNYCTLSTTIATHEESIRDDTRIHTLLEKETKILKEINKITESRNHAIEEAKRKQDVITMALKEKWDIEGKTFKCGVGNATIRMTRSLKIDNKVRLIDTLLRIGKLIQSIKGWDLTYLRKLADAGLFDVDVGETNIIHYDEKENVVISAIKKRGMGKIEPIEEETKVQK